MTQPPQQASFTLPLADPAATLERVGGKGASLARLAAAGLPVPDGFHITTVAYSRFVDANGLEQAIADAARQASAEDPASLERASAEIAAMFARGTVPDEVAAAIREAYGRLGDGEATVAVRSSATAEDLPELSFAGQQETYLNVRGAAAVVEAVKRCWASLWTARAIGYRAQHEIAQDEVRLAVVVQDLVPADAAGVLFTANPLTGNRHEVVINAAWGLGEALVSSQVTPDNLVVDKANGAVLQQQVSDKAVKTVASPEGGTRETAVPDALRGQPALTPDNVAELGRLAVRVETLYGQPMDVEWAIHDGRVALLQARPITALPEPTPGGDPWALPNPKGTYVRGSVLELLPDPLSPLFATLGLPAWSRALADFAGRIPLLGDLFGEEMLATVNGYGYYNLTMTPLQTARIAAGMLIVPMLFPRLLGSARARWQQARARYQALVAREESADLAALPAETLLRDAVTLVDEAARYYVTIQSGVLPGAYLSEAVFSQVYKRLFRQHGWPPALTYLLGYTSAPIQAETSLYDLAQWVRTQPTLADSLAHMTPAAFSAAYQAHRDGSAAEAGAWPDLWRRLDEHLARFGHGIFNLDFARPVPADDPASLLEPLRFFASGEAPDPRARQAAAAQAREQATRTLLGRWGGARRRLIGWLLRAAQAFVVLREDGLADVGLGWPVLRRVLREIGRRLAERGAVESADAVFWLTLDELLEAARALDAGQPLPDAHARVAERRALWERQHAMTPPISLPAKRPTRFLGVDLTRYMPARADQGTSGALRGMGGSPGKVTGTARVIHGPEEFGQMRRGDVLVARITTPAWTPLFALASGVVTDIGGPLSHSSIVAREYHIPAVLGIGVATERLHSGQTVTVDGDAGTVTVH